MVIDFSHGEAKEILLLLEDIQHTVARHEKGSLLTLADLTGAHVDKAVATRMKEVLVRDRPFVKRSAWVGVESVPKVYYDNIQTRWTGSSQINFTRAWRLLSIPYFGTSS